MAAEPPAAASARPGRMTGGLERLGRSATRLVEEVGYAGGVFAAALSWTLAGKRRSQPVRLSAVVSEMMLVGIGALPIVTVLAATIGLMLAFQGIYTLRTFGAESQVTFGIAFSVVREFAALVTAILVAGRSGSALAARLGTMRANQEIDALEVMGINPVRFLVAPPLWAMIVMVPALTFWFGCVALYAAGLYVSYELDISLGAYAHQLDAVLKIGDMLHGLFKSVLFAAIIALVAVVNGVRVTGGAEGIARATTRSVVQAITAIVITDMLFVFVVTR